MFEKLVSSAPPRRRIWNTPAAALSIAAHLLLLGGAVYASVREPAPETVVEEEVSFVEIEEVAEPAAPEAAEPPPPPPPAEVPATPPPPQGFQELMPPIDPPAVIPDVDPRQQAVDAADFSGVGQAGGAARGVDGGVPTNQVPADSVQVFSVEETGVRPELTNTREIVRLLERNYPAQYADAGIAGQVQVKFLIEPSGEVAPGTVTVVDATDAPFADAATRVIQRAKFRPIRFRGEYVRVWATMPITFQAPR